MPDANALPFDVLLLIFSWLPVKDLLSVKCVCHSWRAAAEDEYVWKDHILTLHGKPKDKRNVKLLPAIKKIRGHSDNDFLAFILENMIKVVKLNVHFDPPLSPSQVTLILEKYPELESITLCSCSADILECLEKLKRSKHLQQVVFVNTCCRIPCNDLSLISIFNIFADCNNFPALTDINLSGNQDFTHAFWGNASFRTVISDIIRKRSHQLLSLKLDVGCAESVDVLNAVSSCVKLQTLLIIIRPANCCINIERLSDLKSLSLFAYRENRYFNASLQKSFESGNFARLTKVDMSLCSSKEYTRSSVFVLKALIDNATELKMLRYMDYGNYDLEQQLENIGRLLKLESLYVSGFHSISDETISHVSKCCSLKKLELRSRYLNFDNDHSCFILMLMQLSNLEYLLIRKGDRHGEESGNVFIQFRNREQIETYLRRI